MPWPQACPVNETSQREITSRVSGGGAQLDRGCLLGDKERTLLPTPRSNSREPRGSGRGIYDVRRWPAGQLAAGLCPNPVASTPEPSQRNFNLDEARFLPASGANAQDSSLLAGLLRDDAHAITQVVEWARKGDDSDHYFLCSYKSLEPPTTHF